MLIPVRSTAETETKCPAHRGRSEELTVCVIKRQMAIKRNFKSHLIGETHVNTIKKDGK